MVTEVSRIHYTITQKKPQVPRKKKRLEKETQKEKQKMFLLFQSLLYRKSFGVFYFPVMRNLSKVLGMSLSLRILIIFLSLMGLSLPQKKCQNCKYYMAY